MVLGIFDSESPVFTFHTCFGQQESLLSCAEKKKGWSDVGGSKLEVHLRYFSFSVVVQAWQGHENRTVNAYTI